ncbi:MAG: hypothetical protein C0601_10355 [Candidatus Muiribacterium halophilum]|uniref:Uncharacterized protein n=1 Tax=Muiribacterium halophilum TaxID=2053465 RepID=A0A2N5ZCG8_MUIH1|nr:MAG: hypothetical protein C0601_10355 [Candidatus Muirbacterium halophilum]
MVREGFFFRFLIVLFCIFSLIGCSDEKQKDKVVENKKISFDKDIFKDIDFYIREGMPDKALKIIDKYPENKELLEKKIFILYKKGQYSKVVEIAKDLLDQEQSVSAINTLAKVFYLTRNFNEFEKYARLLNDEQTDEELRRMRESYQKIVKEGKEDDQKTMMKLVRKASEKYNSRDYLDCIMILKDVMKKYNIIYEPGNISVLRDSYIYLARASYKFNNIDDSIFYYRKALETDEKSVQAMQGLGKLFLERGRNNKALELFKESWKLTQDVESYGNMGLCYMNMKDYHKALPILEEMYNIKKKDLNAMYNLFLCYFALDMDFELKKLGTEILREAPVNSDIYDSVRTTLKEKMLNN